MTRGGHRARHLELRQLGQENHDRQTVHKPPQHHRVRHKADELAPPMHDTREDLQKPPHQDHGREQVFDPPMLRDKRHHDHSQRARRPPRDHARTPTDDRSDQPDHEGGIKTYQRMHPPGNKGKRHRLGHKGQSDGKARQHLDPQTGGVQRLPPLAQSQVGFLNTGGIGGQKARGGKVSPIVWGGCSRKLVRCLVDFLAKRKPEPKRRRPPRPPSPQRDWTVIGGRRQGRPRQNRCKRSPPDDPPPLPFCCDPVAKHRHRGGLSGLGAGCAGQ